MKLLDPATTLLVGDVRQRLADLPAESVNTVVTSPPYYGLRDYGTATWDGGDPACPHSQIVGARRTPWANKLPSAKSQTRRNNNYHDAKPPKSTGGQCAACGAVRVDHQVGNEPTLAAYVENMVDVFREVRRVLRPDGTVWLNLGDTIAGSGKSLGAVKRKDLLLVPARVALALQEDGWYVRSEIIWHKPNPMPESVRDRPTKAHETVWLLSRSPRYYYDAAAIAEPVANSDPRYQPGAPKAARSNDATKQGEVGHPMRSRVGGKTRNKRDVWTITPKGYKGAHFAVMPEALAEPCVLAGCPVGGTVLDPFAGSGTVGVVAKRHGRHFVGVELNPEYAELATQRIAAA